MPPLSLSLSSLPFDSFLVNIQHGQKGNRAASTPSFLGLFTGVWCACVVLFNYTLSVKHPVTRARFELQSIITFFFAAAAVPVRMKGGGGEKRASLND